ncbi:hypothetical protein SK128_022237 [Halocaridina rubra]|uniref:Uncharacterized protein n=1 Tax=Halocaridina rubra TaxID=373956 RepID=A0AAN8XTD7_HALRR
MLDDIDVLNSQDQCLVTGLQWLTLSHSATKNNDNAPIWKAVCSVQDLLKSSKLDAIDVTLCLHFSRALLCAEYNTEFITEGFSIISRIGKTYCHESRIATFVIRIFRDLLEKNGKYLPVETQNMMINFTKGVIQKQLKNTLGQPMMEAIFYLNVELTKLDPKREWSRYSFPEYDRCGEIYSMLSSPSHKLRLAATQAVYLLFIQSGDRAHNGDHLDHHFREIYQTALEAVNVLVSL